MTCLDRLAAWTASCIEQAGASHRSQLRIAPGLGHGLVWALSLCIAMPTELRLLVAGAGREVVLMYVQPPELGRDYHAHVNVLYVMQVRYRHPPIMHFQRHLARPGFSLLCCPAGQCLICMERALSIRHFVVSPVPLSQLLTLRVNELAQGFGDRLSRIHRDRQRRKLLSDGSEVVSPCLQRILLSHATRASSCKVAINICILGFWSQGA